MNVLILHAHPEQKSFCSSLAKTAQEWFQSNGHHVEISDLYAMNFNPVGGKGDFTSHAESDYFKYQAEQVKAFENDGFTPDLKREMDKLLACDVLILNFPLWWFGLPAILKGWVDRVFAMGFAYGNGKGVYENGTFPNKKAFLCFTTGGPEVAYNGGKNGDLDNILFPIHHGMLYFTGMTVLPPFISFSPARLDANERAAEIQRYQEYLNNLEAHVPIYTNR